MTRSDGGLVVGHGGSATVRLTKLGRPLSPGQRAVRLGLSHAKGLWLGRGLLAKRLRNGWGVLDCWGWLAESLR